jgi:glycosyltransferase involved in cell wall biosynthesis
MAGIKEQGHRVLMEADDNYVLGVDPRIRGRDWRETIADAQGNHSYEAHTKLCKWVDGIIVSTDNLAAHYSKLNPNIYVCPNSIDPEDWPEPEKPNDGVLRIGWAASHSHLLDVPLIKQAFRWAADQPNVEVHVYGIGDIAKFPGGVKKVGWTDNLTDYRKSLALCDIHVCPLEDTPWSAGKSDLKALEAAMAGAWPIVSTATPYKPWHDRTIACGSKKDWTNALKWAVLHRDEIPALAAEAKDYVTSTRLIEHSKHLWEEAIA